MLLNSWKNYGEEEKKMMVGRLFFVPFLIAGLVALSFAAGSPEKGKALFNDPKLGGSENSTSCETYHLNGKGLEEVTEKKTKIDW